MTIARIRQRRPSRDSDECLDGEMSRGIDRMKILALVTLAFSVFAPICVADGLTCGECLVGHSNLVPFNFQRPWAHGQHERLPAYAGYGSFRPYNYRHVAPQTQIATRWGATPGIPYSAGHANRYQARANAAPSVLQSSTIRRPPLVNLASSPQQLAPSIAPPLPRLKPVPSNSAHQQPTAPKIHVYPTHLR